MPHPASDGPTIQWHRKILNFGVDDTSPPKKRELEAYEIDGIPGIAIQTAFDPASPTPQATVDSVQVGYGWGLASKREAQTSLQGLSKWAFPTEKEISLPGIGRIGRIKIPKRDEVKDFPVKAGFIGYITFLLEMLKQEGTLGQLLLDDIKNLVPIPAGYTPGTGFDFTKTEASYARDPYSLYGVQRIESADLSLLPGEMGKDSGIRVLILNGGTDMRNMWVKAGSEVHAGDGKGSWVIISFPWARILQAEGFLLRPDVMLGNCLHRAGLILAGVSDHSRVHVPVSCSMTQFETVEMTMDDAYSIGAPAALRFAQTTSDQEDVKYLAALGEAKIEAPAKVRRAAELARDFRIELYGNQNSDYLRELYRSIEGTQAAREKAWEVNERELSEERSLPYRLAAQKVGPDMYWQRRVIKEPTQLGEVEVKNPKTAAALNLVGWDAELYYNPQEKSDIAWMIGATVGDILTDVVVPMFGLNVLGLGSKVKLLMPRNIWAYRNMARWVTTYVPAAGYHGTVKDKFAVAAQAGKDMYQFASEFIDSGEAKNDVQKYFRLASDVGILDYAKDLVLSKEEPDTPTARAASKGIKPAEEEDEALQELKKLVEGGAAFALGKIDKISFVSFDQAKIVFHKLATKTKGDNAFTARVRRRLMEHRALFVHEYPSMAEAAFLDPAADFEKTLERTAKYFSG
ncbi:hypothetical protein ACFVSN_30355 [Kitasatospora sp. NPDC057904]|uniref:hypothetical protein n=1 Tax=unclassified Kitasatospora TaxID=2633591 RepID=UPI0036DB35B2